MFELIIKEDCQNSVIKCVHIVMVCFIIHDENHFINQLSVLNQKGSNNQSSNSELILKKNIRKVDMSSIVEIKDQKEALLEAEDRYEVRRTGITMNLSMNPLDCSKFAITQLNNGFQQFTETKPLKVYNYGRITHILAVLCEILNSGAIAGKECFRCDG